MISKLRHKILIGILLLAILLAASGSMVLYQFSILNRSVDALIEDNYKTIQACQKMLEALEREDSGILLLSLGNWEQGRAVVSSADSSFAASLAIAENNLTEENEDRYVAAVKAAYSSYRLKWEKPIVDTEREGNLEWYTQEVNPAFMAAKDAVYALMALNQESMYGEASLLKEQSHRAIMPGIVAIVAVIIFAFLFSFFLTRSLAQPVQKLIEATREFRPNMTVFAPNLKADDEFKELKEGIQGMVSRINRFHERTEKARS